MFSELAERAREDVVNWRLLDF